MPPARRRQPVLVLVVACVTALIAVSVCVAAVLAPAPAAALPLVVTLCIGGPMFASWDVPLAVASLRTERAGRDAMATLRRTLKELPEVEHPLGL